MNVLMICLGNICRSPLAEGILKKKVEEKKLPIKVDSAGFTALHQGSHADRRAIATAERHGVDISNIFSRLFTYDDFQNFDHIFVMDYGNYADVIRKARTAEDRQKVDYILNTIHPNQNREVPDPYYGGESGFENVFSMLDEACEKICELYQNNKL